MIKTVDQGDAAIYTCRVTQTTTAGSIFIDGATTTLGVLTSVPVVTSAALASTTVGQAYDFTPTASGSPNKWVMTGLPTGLTFNSVTGRITGKALVGSPQARTST